MEVILQQPSEPLSSHPELRLGAGMVGHTPASPFGISLQRASMGTAGGGRLVVERGDMVDAEGVGVEGAIYISAIERGSPAERCGLLQVGYKLLVNQC